MNLYQTHMNCSVYLHSMPIYMKLNAFALGICFCHRSFLLFARIFGVSSRVNQRYKKKRRIRVNVVCVYVADQWSCLWRIHTRATNVCYYCKLWMVAWRFCGVRWHEELLDRSNTASYVRSRIEYNYWMDHLCVCCLCSWASFNRASSDWIEWMHILEENKCRWACCIGHRSMANRKAFVRPVYVNHCMPIVITTFNYISINFLISGCIMHIVQ